MLEGMAAEKGPAAQKSPREQCLKRGQRGDLGKQRKTLHPCHAQGVAWYNAALGPVLGPRPVTRW